MIFTLLSNFFILIVLIGYSYIFKFLILKETDSKVVNLDLLFGVIISVFFSILLNFVTPLKYISLIFFIIGLFFFIFSIYKKKLNINFSLYILLILYLSLITYDNGNNVDSPVYHYQTINWSVFHKVVFGLSNLDWLYSLNSNWHNFLAIYYFSFSDFNTIYTLNILIFVILFYEVFFQNQKKPRLSDFTIYFITFYLIFFSLIHPFKNGMIFNQIGNPEVDNAAAILFIISFYVYLKFEETKKRTYFNYLLVSCFLCITTKITYAGVIIFPIIILFKNFLFIKNKLSIFLILISSLWLIRNYVLSSCFIYPVLFTCLESKWYLGDSVINELVNLTKGFSRDTRLRANYTNFDAMIYSWQWFYPWFKDYFLNTSLLKINSFLITISIIYITITFAIKRSIVSYGSKINFFLIISFLANIYIWLQAPEIRFGWGMLISYTCMIFAISFINFKLINNFFSPPRLKFILILVIFGSVLKNNYIIKFDNLFKIYSKNLNYDHIRSLGNYSGLEIFISDKWMCGEFKGICVNYPKENFNITYKYNYLIFNKN